VAFGINVRNLVDSPLAQGLSEADGLRPEWLKLTSHAGFDPLRDIDELLLASSGEGQNAPAIVVLRGRFNVARLGAGAKAYHGVPVLEASKGAKGSVAFLAESTAILGDLDELHAAIDRRGRPSRIDPTFSAKVADLRARYDIWGFGTRPDGLIPATAQPSGFESVDRFEIGVSLSHGLDLAAEIHAASPQDVAKLTASLKLLELMLKAQQPSMSGAQVALHSENGTLRISLNITEEEFKKAIAAQRAALQQALAPQPAPRPAPKPAPPQVLTKDGDTLVLTLPGKR